MLHIIHGQRVAGHEDLIDQMHKLRARSFKDRRGWRVNVEDGRERDGFDQLDPLYVIVSDGAGTVVGSLRLLPSTGPYMMADVFPEVIGDQGLIRHPLVWESSRFCVDTEVAKVYSEDGVNQVTRELLIGAIQTALAAGVINIVSVYDIFVERVLRRTGCVFTRCGPVVAYDEGLKTTAGLFEVSEHALSQLGAYKVEPA
jgi:acyl homoserine lactone synthase